MHKSLLIFFLLSLSSFLASMEKTDDLDAEIEKEYPLFKSVKKIKSILQEVSESSEKNLLPGPHHNQTKQGLRLQVQDAPTALHTPWGQINLYVDTNYFLEDLAITQLFLKRVRAKFLGIPSLSIYHGKKIYEIIQPVNPAGIKHDMSDDEWDKYHETIEKQIPEQELKNYLGKECFVTSHYCECNALYEITHIDDKPIEPLVLLEEKDFRTEEKLAKIWHALNTKYNKEMEHADELKFK